MPDIPTTAELLRKPLAWFRADPRNARTHSPAQLQKLRASIREFGFVAPILADAEGRVLAGHGRLQAAEAEGLPELPVVIADWLTEEQRRAYILADNRLTELGGWDEALLSEELLALEQSGFAVTLTGFDPEPIRKTPGPEADHFWETEGEPTDEYSAFVDKFKPRLTSDDCYTPANVYAALLDWARSYYSLGDAQIIRPFFPGGDYRAADYPPGCCVIDNPPFSILSEICKFYDEQNVRFLLFAPALTLFSTGSGRFNYLPVSVNILFENKADISISFVTNLGEFKIDTVPQLYAALHEQDTINRAAIAVELPTYRYPPELLTQSISLAAKNGIPFRVSASECSFTRALDAQREKGKAIYGAGFLLSEKAAAEKAAAEKAAAEKAAAEKAAAEKAAAVEWTLSDRERDIIVALTSGKAVRLD